MSNLEPLEFKECVVDSPWFREKLLLHEKELENKSDIFSNIYKNITDVYKIFEDCSKAFVELADNLLKFISNEDQDLSETNKMQAETEDEKRIRRSVQVFSDMLTDIDAMLKKHILGSSKDTVIYDLQELESIYLTRSKQDIKDFKKNTAIYYSKLDKYCAHKYKQDSEFDSIDADFGRDRSQFVKDALQYVSNIMDTEEKKTSKLVHTLSLLFTMFKTYHHEAFDHVEDQILKIGEINDSVNRTMESYTSITTDTSRLMEQILEMKIEHVQPDPEIDDEVRREGYLFVQTKKQISSDWSRKYCVYERSGKKLCVYHVNQAGLSSSQKMQCDEFQVVSCEGKLPANAARRFCFDLKVLNLNTPLTLQALTKEDQSLWINVMEGREHACHVSTRYGTSELKSVINDKSMRLMRLCLSEIEKRGIDEKGIYRITGKVSVRDVLLKKIIDDVNNSFQDSVSSKDMESFDVHTLASTIKSYIKCLKIPLATHKLYDDFMAAGKKPNEQDKFDDLLIVVRRLPAEHFQMFSLVVHHLAKIALNQSKNSMPAPNLAICFSPTIFQPKEEQLSVACIKDSKFATDALQVLIERCEEIFHESNCNKGVTVNVSKSMRIAQDDRKMRNDSPRRQSDSAMPSTHSSIFSKDVSNVKSITTPIKEMSSNEEIRSYVRSIMTQLQSLVSLADWKGTCDVVKQLNKIFVDYCNYQQYVADILEELEFPSFAQRTLQKLNNMGVFKNNDSWFNTFYLYSICWNYANVSFTFASSLALNKMPRLLVLNISYQPYLDKLSSANVEFMIKASLGIIHAMCRYPGNGVHFRSDSAKTALCRLATQGKDVLRIVAAQCLAMVVSEEDDNLLSRDGGDVMRDIVNFVRTARTDDQRKYLGYRSHELLGAIRSASVVTSERTHFLDLGGVSLLKEVLFASTVVNEELVECLEIVCNVASSEHLIPRLLGAGLTAAVVAPLARSDHVRVKSLAMDYLWRLELTDRSVCAGSVVSSGSMDRGEGPSYAYLCYSRLNLTTVVKLQKKFTDSRIIKFIEPERYWEAESVKRAIERCSVVIVCVSEALKSEPRLQLEVDFCDRIHKPIVPLLIQQKYVPDGWLAQLLERLLKSGVELIDLSSRVDFDASWAALDARLRSMGGSEAVSSTVAGDATDWLHHHGLGHLATHLAWLTMDLLRALQQVKAHAQDYFYRTLEIKLGLDLVDILKFSMAIDRL